MTDFFERWRALDGANGLRVREVPCIGTSRALLCVDGGKFGRPLIALTAGMHGDEPAGVWALLEFVERNMLEPGFAYRIWPCVNPTGLEQGTRFSAGGVDVNRTFAEGGVSPEARTMLAADEGLRFSLSIDLHEDCDASGFYCYDYCGDTRAIGKTIARAFDAAGLPLQDFESGFDLGVKLPTGAIRFARGIVYADPIAEAKALGALTYSLRAAQRAAGAALTFETPGAAAWEQRIAMHQLALQTALRSAGARLL